MTLRMKDHGEFLGSRTLGERVRTQVVDMLRSAPGRLVLDFAGVRLMTQSFADEAFRKLLDEIPEPETARLAVQNLTDDVRAVLRYAMSKSETTPR